jgi:hypothetical protein
MKDVINTNSEAFGKTGAGTSKPESSAFLIFFIFLRTPNWHSGGIACATF